MKEVDDMRMAMTEAEVWRQNAEMRSMGSEHAGTYKRGVADGLAGALGELRRRTEELCLRAEELERAHQRLGERLYVTILILVVVVILTLQHAAMMMTRVP